MSKDLGYVPAPAGPGKDGYNPKYKEGDSNYHRKNKNGQEGLKAEPNGTKAGDHLSDNNGTCNSDPS